MMKIDLLKYIKKKVKMAARVRCIRRKCTCGKLLGYNQALFEMMLRDCENPGEDEETILNNLGKHNTVLGILNRLGYTKMCCLQNMMYIPTYPVVDANSGNLIDDAGLINQTATSRKERYVVENGPSVYMEDVPSFPTFG